MRTIWAIFVCVSFLISCQVLKPEEPGTLTASFVFSPAEPVAGQPVQFTDTSTGDPSRWEWAFGDGTTSTVQNPSHTYASAGSYAVSLTIGKGTNTDSSSRMVTVAPETTGSVYYIDTAHASASDSNPGTQALPWKTITKANQTLVAGETVYIKAGTYSSYIAPARSGTASNRITYRAYGSDIVTVRDASYGILFDGRSYITVQGINFYNLDRFMYLINGSNHNIVAYCNFDQVRNRIAWPGSRIAHSSQHNWIHHCRFSKYGEYDTSARGSVLDIGNDGSSTDLSNYNLIEDSVLFHGGHHVLGVYGAYNVIRNNYLHNENWYTSGGNTYGARVVSVMGYSQNSGRNLFEGNRVGYSGYPINQYGSPGISFNTSYNIARGNKFYYNNLPGIAMTLTSSYYQSIVHNRIYNNTFLHNGFNPDAETALKSAIGMRVSSGSNVIVNNAIKNNLYYSHYQPHGAAGCSLNDQIIENNWNGDTAGNPLFVDAGTTLGDPMDADYPDLRLQSNSPCIDAGGALTTITSPTGSGSVLTVADAGYFMDGWGIAGVQGDLIQIVGTTRRARITNVNYSTNTITVDTTLTWTHGQGIALAYEGSAPDVGAFEYGSQSASVRK